LISLYYVACTDAVAARTRTLKDRADVLRTSLAVVTAIRILVFNSFCSN